MPELPKYKRDFDDVHVRAYQLATGVAIGTDPAKWPKDIATIVVFDMRKAQNALLPEFRDKPTYVACMWLEQRKEYLAMLRSIAPKLIVTEVSNAVQ